MKKGLNTLATGWNTWNTRSVLSHVLLPEGIAISLGFKSNANGAYLKEALVGRKGKGDEKTHPGIRTYDGRYTDLKLEWMGAAWRVQSALALDKNDLVILIESVGEKQTRPPLVVAEIGLLWNRPGRSWREGDNLVAESPGRTVRVYATRAHAVEPYIWTTSPYLALPADAACGFSTRKRRTLDEIRAIIDARRQERVSEGAAFGDASEIRDAMQTCLAWDTVYDPLHDRVISPVSRIWNCGWGGYVMFCWDSYFAAMMAAVDNKELAYANAYAVTREGIKECGMVPNFVSPTGYFSRDRSQPPVGGGALLHIHKRHKEPWILKELFDDLLAWNRWWPQHRLNGGLLTWGSTPFQPVTGHIGETSNTNVHIGAAYESGLDNSPMYDGVKFDDTERHILLMQDVGLSSLYIWDCDSLAEIANVLGRVAEAQELTQRAEQFRNELRKLWDEKTGLFLNKNTVTGELCHRLTPAHFYPLLAKAPTREQARRMIDEHFFNPREFWGEWIIPSCSRDDAAYKDQDYWRGRIWGPMNFLVYLGLKNYDLPDATKALVEKSAALLLKEWREHGHVCENYCGDTGDGCGKWNSDAFYHWGGLLGLMSVMEK